ncbi:MAG: hypothetical protein PUB67_02945 [Clostridiales bacterium]|nr:hypothetical protein [Clostridiales bacterium]
MIDCEKVKLMTKCAIYESHEGNSDIEGSKYRKSDYIGLAVIRNIAASAVGYLLLIGILFLYNMDMLVKIAFTSLIKKYFILLTGIYFGIVLIIIACTYYLSSREYNKSRKRLSKYVRMLKQINKMTIKGEAVDYIDKTAE